MSIRTATALAVALCALPLLAHGEDGEGSDSLAYKANEQAARPLAARGPTTVEEMEAFVDGFMDAQMKSGPIAGAAVVVVKDGQVFFQKGYGHEDTEKRTPVDPAQTLFRPGSVSKLFTWTAIMQLVEQGKIDLDADVNTYLKDFKVDATFPEPVKVRNIMTHTARLRRRWRRLPVRGHGRRPVAARPMAGCAPAGARSAADDRLQRWHERVVFELGHGAGRSHRRGRLGPVVR